MDRDYHRPSYAKGYVKGRADKSNEVLGDISVQLKRIADHMESDKMAQGIHNAISDSLFQFWRDRMT